MTPFIISAYSASVHFPAQGAMQRPSSLFMQGRFGRAGGSAWRQERNGKTSRTASITCRTALAPM